MKEKGIAMPGIKIRKNAVVKTDSKGPNLYANSKSTAIIAGNVCTATTEGGQPSVSLRLLSGFSARL
jgi:hypothetical protein